jgi:hypothetical protein
MITRSDLQVGRKYILNRDYWGVPKGSIAELCFDNDDDSDYPQFEFPPSSTFHVPLDNLDLLLDDPPVKKVSKKRVASVVRFDREWQWAVVAPVLDRIGSYLLEKTDRCWTRAAARRYASMLNEDTCNRILTTGGVRYRVIKLKLEEYR